MAGVDKGNAYHTSDACADTLEVMNKRLSQDLRHRVRRIGYYPPLSPEWREVAEIIAHLSQVASMESKDAGKKEGSVWERDELCIRYIIEESKTNLLMRLMIEFKTFMYEKAQTQTQFDNETAAVLKRFEGSLGELLKCLFTAIESLQTLDISAMMEHIERTFVAANANTSTYDSSSQEVAVVAYLHLIVTNADRLDEDKVMSLLLDHNIFPAILQHYELFGERSGDLGVEMYVWLVSYILDSEHFQSHRNEYLPTPEDKKRLVNFEAPAKALKAAETDSDRRRKVRALCDNIIRYK